MAYIPWKLVSGLCVYPAGRFKGEDEGKAHRESFCSVDADGNLAWGELDISAVGTVVLPASDI